MNTALAVQVFILSTNKRTIRHILHFSQNFWAYDRRRFICALICKVQMFANSVVL